MTDLKAPADLFGVPLAISVEDARQLKDALTALWTNQVGRLPLDLDSDLAEMGRWWDPKARGMSLRDRLAALPPTSLTETPFLSDQLILHVDQSRAVMTIEGRILIGVLETALAGLRQANVGDTGLHQDLVVIPPSIGAAASHKALVTYRAWSQGRLRDVVSLLRGEGSLLLPPVAALILLLLVNRSTSRERALARPTDPTLLADVDSAIAEALRVFADRIRESRHDRKRDPRHFSLYQGYLLSEAARRLGGDLIRDGDVVYLADGREDAVIDFLARDLARRRDLTADGVRDAFDALVTAVRGPVGRLALHNSAHELPGATRHLRERLLKAFVRHRPAPPEPNRRPEAGPKSDQGEPR